MKCTDCEKKLTDQEASASLICFAQERSFRCIRCAIKYLKSRIDSTEKFVLSYGGWDTLEANHPKGFLIAFNRKQHKILVEWLEEYQELAKEIDSDNHVVKIREFRG